MCKRYINHLLASCMPPTGDLTCNPDMCPDWESNRQPFSLQAGTQSTELHQPGQQMVLEGMNVNNWMTSGAMHFLFNRNKQNKQIKTRQKISSSKTGRKRRAASWGQWEGREYPFEPCALIDSALDLLTGEQKLGPARFNIVLLKLGDNRKSERIMRLDVLIGKTKGCLWAQRFSSTSTRRWGNSASNTYSLSMLQRHSRA